MKLQFIYSLFMEIIILIYYKTIIPTTILEQKSQML